MGAKYKEVGGGPAVGVADDFATFLRGIMSGSGGGGVAGPMANALNRNTPGAVNNPITGQGGLAGLYSSILSPGAGVLGGNLASLLQRQTDRNINALRARFGATNSSYGTGAGQAESLFRVQAADQIPLDVANLQLSVANPLLGMINSFAQRGISQRGVVAEQNPFLAALQGVSGAAQGVAGIMSGGGGGGGIGGGGMNMGGAPNLSNFGFPNVASPSGFLPPMNGFNLPTLPNDPMTGNFGYNLPSWMRGGAR